MTDIPTPDQPDEARTLVRSMRRVAQAIDIRSREIARLTGLTLPQLLVLQSVRSLGEVTTQAVSRDVFMSPPTVVVVLDKLEAKGMIVRYRSTVDRRVVHARLTDAGSRALASSPGLLGDDFMTRFARLPRDERVAMAAAIETLATLMRPDVAPLSERDA